MKNKNLKPMIFAALFAALTFVATVTIRIPTPGTSGYIHPGDAIVIISGIILGPGWGALAAGIGSAFADILGGFAAYAPVTFAIKAAIALITGFIYRGLTKNNPKNIFLPVALGGVTDIILVAGGYLLWEIPLYSLPTALLAVPANLIQGAGGLVFAMILCPLLLKVPDIRRLSDEMCRRK